MKFTDVLGLPCPDSTDYAVLPVYMQDLAEQLEAKILAQRATMTAFDSQPAAIFRTPFQLGPNGANSAISFIDVGQVIFTNYSIPGKLLDFIWNPGQLFPSSGIYLVGYNVSCQNTGAVGDLTKRKMYCRVIRTSTTGAVTVLADLTSEVPASSATNGEAFGNITTVAISDQDLPLASVLMSFTHNDGTSSVLIPLGGITAFVKRVGSTDIIEVT